MSKESSAGIPPEEYNPEALQAPHFRNSERGMSMSQMEDLGIVTPQARDDMSAYRLWDNEEKKELQASEEQIVNYYKKFMSDDEAETAVKLEKMSYWTNIGSESKVSRKGIQKQYNYVRERVAKYETIMDQELMDESDKEAAEIARRARNVWIGIQERVQATPWLLSIVEDRD